ncbi:extended synaptotagmin-2-like isoform X2 [Mercenaria mercenaria]|uniref:extended synaptotagmin-2-like isoform X2 n=1 Tax=Mercenaria mercenaria TaxID=6596 RepID=UPI00234F5B31|nr:extended synaptotagmin-2-like isoform X2 [Mercenaria mercenaria]
MANEKQPAKTKRKAVTEDTLLVSVLKRYFKYAGAAVAIWGFGYYQFSPAWILLGLVVVTWKEKHNKLQQKKIEISQHAAKNEKEAILARVEDLPSWVFFPDVERAEWVNKMVAQMWPYIGEYVRELLMTSVQKTVQDSASVMGSFKFINIDLGDIPPRIGGVKVYTEKVKRDEIYMDLDLIYSSDCEIEVKVKGVTAGIKDLQLHGTVRVIFKPLINKVPFFGGLSVFFMNNPSIDFNLTSLANALDLPGLNDMLQTIIQENIANIMVLPNRIVVQTAQGLEVSKLRYPQPDGVLRIYVVEAKDLVKADLSVLGKGKSDPYSVVRVGAMKFKTHVINNTVIPQWNRVFETIIDEKDGQFMDVEVRDEDPGSKDDKLGNVSIELSPVAEKGLIDNWLPLENVKSGKLHLKLVWLYLSKNPQMLNKQIASNRVDNKKKDTDDLSSCILMVNVDSARELPRSKKMSEPSPYVIVNVGQKTEESKVVNDSTDPRWEQGFRFLVNDPNFQTVDFKLMDKKTDKQIGEMTYSLKNLMSAPDMEVDRFFPLKKAEGNSELSLRLALRVLTTEQSVVDESENLMTEPIPDAKETDLDEAATKDSTKPAPAPSSAGAKAGGPIKPVSVETVKAASPQAQGQIIPPAKSPSQERETEVRQRKTPSVSSTESNLGAYRLGRIQITLRYSMQRGKLIVVVHKCTSLLACDKDHFSDPYVKMYLLPDKGSSSKRKTKTVNNNLNPVFDETFEYSVTPQELPERSLEITVKNETSMFSSSQKELGMVLIELNKMDISKASTEWYDLCPEDQIGKKEIETDI